MPTGRCWRCSGRTKRASADEGGSCAFPSLVCLHGMDVGVFRLLGERWREGWGQGDYI